MTILKIASAQYSMPAYKTIDDWILGVERWVAEAVNNQAKLLVFPEYGSIELISLMNKETQKNLMNQLREIQNYHEIFFQTYLSLAKKYQVIIIAPSFPYQLKEGSFVNRSYVFSSDGRSSHQEKQMMTRFENEEWQISSGKTEMVMFEVEKIKFGISICYDIEFPDFSRNLALAGAQLNLAPSCTESLAGMNRVHVGARARALENQLYVVVSQTVGDVNYSEAVDKNTGKAAVYSTCDLGFPDDGIIASGIINESTWLYATLDFDKLHTVRNQGRVFNFRDLQKLPGVE